MFRGHVALHYVELRGYTVLGWISGLRQAKYMLYHLSYFLP